MRCVHAGGLLDYDAVKAGLESGHIGGLGLDVQWSEPFDPQDWIAQHPRCVAPPDSCSCGSNVPQGCILLAVLT